MTWQPYFMGKTIGTAGLDAGKIIQDEEHLDGARITLEKECKHAPFSISCSVYGWMVHTCFFADQFTATDAYEAMKDDLNEILAQIPRDDAVDVEAQVDQVDLAIEAFIERYN